MNDSAPTALLVENEPQIRRFVRAALEEEGWQVHESATLQRGLNWMTSIISHSGFETV